MNGFLDISGGNFIMRNGTITANGDASFNRNVFIKNNLYATADVSFSGNLFNKGTINSKTINFVLTSSSTDISPTSTITDSATLPGIANGNLTIQSGNISLNNGTKTAIQINSQTINANLPFNSLSVATDASINRNLYVLNDISGNANLTITGNAFIGGQNTRVKQLYLDKLTFNDLGITQTIPGIYVSNDSSFNGNVAITSLLKAAKIESTDSSFSKLNVNGISQINTVYVLGDASLNKNTYIEKLDVSSISINTAMTSMCDVVLNKQLSVTGKTFFLSDLSANETIFGNSGRLNTLTVNESATLNAATVNTSLTANSVTAQSGGITTDGAFTSNAASHFHGINTFYGDTGTNVVISGGTLQVDGQSTFYGETTISSLTVNDGLTMGSNVNMQTHSITNVNSLTATTGTIDNLTGGNTTLNQTTTVTGNMNFNSGTNLTADTLSASNATFSSLTVNNSTTECNIPILKSTTIRVDGAGTSTIANLNVTERLIVPNNKILGLTDLSSISGTINTFNSTNIRSTDSSLNKLKSDDATLYKLNAYDASFAYLKCLETADMCGNVNVKNNVTINGILSLGGGLQIPGGLYLGTSPFSAGAISGASSITAPAIYGTDLSLNGNITALSQCTVGGQLNVLGGAYLRDTSINATTTTINSNLNVSNNVNFTGASYLTYAGLVSLPSILPTVPSTLTITCWILVSSSITASQTNIFKIGTTTLLSITSGTFSIGATCVYNKWQLVTFILNTSTKIVTSVYINTTPYALSLTYPTALTTDVFQFGAANIKYRDLKIWTVDLSPSINNLYLESYAGSDTVLNVWYPLTNAYYQLAGSVVTIYNSTKASSANISTTSATVTVDISTFSINHTNIGIGSPIEPAYKMAVTGDMSFNGNVFMASTKTLNLGGAASAAGYLLNVNGSIQAAGYNATSDMRLKTNVKLMNKQIDLIKKVTPVNFNWINDGKYDYGFIAQELYKTYPDLKTNLVFDSSHNLVENPTDENGQPIYYTVDYGKLSCILWKGLIDSLEMIETQQTEIVTLREKIEKIEKYLNV